MTTPLLGFITKDKRTQAQHDAHDRALKSFPKFAIPGWKEPNGPVKVLLTDLWKDPLVVADIGYEFTGYHQLTGSCVGVSTGNAVFTLGAVQRKLATNPTKAFIPWWPFDYGVCRYNEGDRGQGEGAIDSVMAQTLIKDGVVPYSLVANLPTFDKSDGLTLTSKQEMTYSDGAYSGNTALKDTAKKFPVGSAGVLNSTADIKAAILNGYPVLDGCDQYIGNGSLQGDIALGSYDGNGGHSTCLAPETKVSLLNGTEKSIKELADSGEEVWVYSYDNGKIVPRRAKAQMTRAYVAEGLIRVGLDNGEFIDCTLDHKFMLRDGTWKEANNLNPGDSLMPLYRKFSDKEKDILDGYEMVMDPDKDKWIYTHRRVSGTANIKCLRLRNSKLVEEKLPEGVKGVIHHVNFNKLDNRPENLSRVPSDEHLEYHSERLEEQKKDPIFRKKQADAARNWCKTLNSDPILKEKRKKAHQTEETRKRHSETSKKMWENEEIRNQIKESLKKSWQDPVVIKRRDEARSKMDKEELGKKIAEGKHRKFLERQAQKVKNHKVTSILYLPGETGPVFCLEVEKSRNFGSHGVIIHNCYLGYWDHPTQGPVFCYSNQWSGNTYPQDNSGKGRCTVWVKEANVAKLFNTGGSGGETVALSHLTFFPAQPTVLDWYV